MTETSARVDVVAHVASARVATGDERRVARRVVPPVASSQVSVVVSAVVADVVVRLLHHRCLRKNTMMGSGLHRSMAWENQGLLHGVLVGALKIRHVCLG